MNEEQDRHLPKSVSCRTVSSSPLPPWRRYNTNINSSYLFLMSGERLSGAQTHLALHFQGKPRCSLAGLRWTELKRVTNPHIKIPASRTDMLLVTVTWLWVTCQSFPCAGFASAFRNQWLCLWQHIQGAGTQLGLKSEHMIIIIFYPPFCCGWQNTISPWRAWLLGSRQAHF